jgi:hypothetical protein
VSVPLLLPIASLRFAAIVDASLTIGRTKTVCRSIGRLASRPAGRVGYRRIAVHAFLRFIFDPIQ